MSNHKIYVGKIAKKGLNLIKNGYNFVSCPM